MSDKSQLEELVKRRRNVQDLDLDWYIKIKTDILKAIIDVKNNRIPSVETLDKLENDLKLGKLKATLGLDLELARLLISKEETEHYEKNITLVLRNYILSSAKDFKQLSNKIEYTREILKHRENLNRTIDDYFTKTKIVKLTRNELNLLFDKDTNDLKMILASGKLIHEDKSNSMNDQYEFTFSKNSSFRLSAKDLDAKISMQIQECDEIENNIQQAKQTWKLATIDLVSLLDKIEQDIVI